MRIPPNGKIKDTLRNAEIPGERYFFTNAYLGLRTSSKSTGRSPGASNLEFKQACRAFLAYQVELQKPRLIVCLGHEPRRCVAPVLLHGRHIWSRQMSFTNLDLKCEAIVQGSLIVENKNISPLIVVIAHPSQAQPQPWHVGRCQEIL